MNAKQAATFMRAFSDGTRLRILGALAHHKLTVCELAGLLRCPHFRVSRHLRYLHARGVVECGPKGHAVVYHLTAPRHELHASALKALLGCVHTLGDVELDTARLAKMKGVRPPASPARSAAK